MRICHLAPAIALDRVIPDEVRTHLVVADEIVENDRYRAFYQARKDRGDFIIMDSMAFERPEGTQLDTMIQAIRMLMPDELVLLDDMANPDKSLAMARNTAREIQMVAKRLRFMAVPHGHTWEEYLDNAYELSNIPGVSTLGVQEEVDELYGMRRERVVKELNKRFPRSIHMLGMVEDLQELVDPETKALVRTCDSAKLIVWGLNGVSVTPDTDPTPQYPGRKSISTREGYFKWMPKDSFKRANYDVARANVLAWEQEMASV